MHVNVDSLRPQHNDVIMIHHSRNKVNTVYIKEDEDQETVMFFKVLRTGNGVKMVKEGDIVSVPWRRCVPPFETLVGGDVKKVTVTSEDEILFILEDD